MENNLTSNQQDQVDALADSLMSDAKEDSARSLADPEAAMAIDQGYVEYSLSDSSAYDDSILQIDHHTDPDGEDRWGVATFHVDSYDNVDREHVVATDVDTDTASEAIKNILSDDLAKVDQDENDTESSNEQDASSDNNLNVENSMNFDGIIDKSISDYMEQIDSKNHEPADNDQQSDTEQSHEASVDDATDNDEIDIGDDDNIEDDYDGWDSGDSVD